MAFAKVAGVRRFEHGDCLRAKREHTHQRTYGQDDGVLWRHGVGSGRAFFFQQTDGNPAAANASLKQV
jgi:hypothetical protein